MVRPDNQRFISRFLPEVKRRGDPKGMIVKPPVSIIDALQPEHQATLLMCTLNKREWCAAAITDAQIRDVGFVQLYEQDKMIAQHLIAPFTALHSANDPGYTKSYLA
jgi:hypothetical protein